MVLVCLDAETDHALHGQVSFRPPGRDHFWETRARFSRRSGLDVRWFFWGPKNGPMVEEP